MSSRRALSFVLVLPGVIARALYPNLPKADTAYPRLVSDLLPVGLLGLVLAGRIATLMSSMGACYNASATLVVRDFFMRWKPGLSDREQVAIGHRATVLMAALGVLAAPLDGNEGTRPGRFPEARQGSASACFCSSIRPSAGRSSRTAI